jgi:PKHD-type hydroxylase
MIFSLAGYQGRYYRHFESMPDLLTLPEIERIVQVGDALEPAAATVDTDEGAVLDTELRGARVAWLSVHDGCEFLFHRLAEAAQRMNDAHYRFDLAGFGEDIQYTVYEAPSAGYGWHADIIDWPRHLTRKLSLTVQLTPEDDYDGGDLEFRDGDVVQTAPRRQGTLVAFPSWSHHRVSPVTRGVRRSLVAWTAGPAFR